MSCIRVEKFRKTYHIFSYNIIHMTEDSSRTRSKKKSHDPSINFKIIGLILIGSAAFQVALYLQIEIPDAFDVIDSIYLLGPILCSIFGFLVAKRYKGSEVFGRAYLMLGIAFFSFFMGELLYIYYEIDPLEDPYPSIADVFYFAFYPLAMAHLFLNIRYFKRRFDTLTKIWPIVLALLIIGTYSYFSYEDYGEFNFDYYYGLIFVSGAGFLLSMAVLGAVIFRSSILGIIWLLLVVGLFFNTFADVWYYYSEIFGSYNNIHPANTLWITAYMVIIYGLYKHIKSI